MADREYAEPGFGEKVDDQLADAGAGIRPQPPERELSGRPLITGERNGCHFTISRIGDSNDRAQFFYRGQQQYYTGIDDRDDLTERGAIKITRR